MTPWESLLQSNNGSSIIKQLALIALFILEYIYIYDTQSTQISQKQGDHNIYVIMKTMNNVPSMAEYHHHNSFVATHAIGHMIYEFPQSHCGHNREGIFIKREGTSTKKLFLSKLEGELFSFLPDKPQSYNMSKEEWRAMRNVAEDGLIIIKPADKDSCVVVWGREDYLAEGYKQLSDSTMSHRFWHFSEELEC